MWVPSNFAFRVVGTTSLLAHFVAREAHKVKVTLVQVLACVVLASIVHLAIAFGYRQAVGQLSGLSFSALAAVEMFLVLQLTVQVARYLRSG
jgi:hypothetical protein